jgi:hypothetical protein
MRVFFSIVILLLVNSCMAITVKPDGMLNDHEIPYQISVGKSRIEEILSKFGEPDRYRKSENREYLEYYIESGEFYLLIGFYSKRTIRFEFSDSILVFKEMYKTGSGWGIFLPPFQTPEINNSLN